MKNTPNKSHQHRKEEIPTSHKAPQSYDQSGVKDQAPKERATTETKQPDFENEPRIKPDPSRYTEEE